MAMAQKTQGGGKRQGQAGGESTLAKYKDVLVATQGVYAKGVTELPVDLRSKWDFAMREDRDTLMGFVIFPVAAGKMEPRLAELVLGKDGKYAALANDWAAVTKFTGQVPGGFTRFDAEESLRALSAKRGTPKGDDWLAMCEAVESQRGLGSMLRHWTERTGPFAERPHGREEKKGEVAAAIAEMGGKPARVTTLQQQLDEAKAAKAAALANEDADALKAAKADIARLEAEIAAAATATPNQPTLQDQLEIAKAAKAAALANEDADALKSAKADIARLEAEIAAAAKPVETEEATVPGLDGVIAAATAVDEKGRPKAGKGLRLLYTRWDKGGEGAPTDEQFVASARAMGAIK